MRNDYQNELEKIHVPESLKQAVKVRMQEEEMLNKKRLLKKRGYKSVRRYFPAVGATAAVLIWVFAGGQFFLASGGGSSSGNYAADMTAGEAEKEMMAVAGETEREMMAAAGEAEGEMMAASEAAPEEKAAEEAAGIEEETKEIAVLEDAQEAEGTVSEQGGSPGLFAGEKEVVGKIVTPKEFDLVFGTQFAELEGKHTAAYLSEEERLAGSLEFSLFREEVTFRVSYSVGRDDRERNVEGEYRTIDGYGVLFFRQEDQGYAVWSENSRRLVISWENPEDTQEAFVESVVEEVLGKME